LAEFVDSCGSYRIAVPGLGLNLVVNLDAETAITSFDGDRAQGRRSVSDKIWQLERRFVAFGCYSIRAALLVVVTNRFLGSRVTGTR